MDAIWEIIRWPFAQVLYYAYEWFGSYAFALFVFALAIKLITLPLSIKQQKTQIKTAKLRPKMAAIEKKYAGRTDRKTLEKKQQELTALQQEEGFSPLSGCLPMLIQMPIIIILYTVVQSPLTYLGKFGIAELEQILQVLESNEIFLRGAKGAFQEYDVLKNALALGESVFVGHETTLGVFGQEIWDKLVHLDLHLINIGNFKFMDLSATPALKSLTDWSSATWLLLSPVLVYVSSFLSMKLTRKFTANPAMAAATDDMKRSNMIMDLVMPAMSLFIAFRVPAALGLYWIYQSILGFVQQLILAKVMPLPTYTEEEIREINKAEKAKQAAALAAAKQRRITYSDDEDDDDEDVELPEIKSKFDREDDEPAAPSTQNKKKKK